MRIERQPPIWLLEFLGSKGSAFSQVQTVYMYAYSYVCIMYDFTVHTHEIHTTTEVPIRDTCTGSERTYHTVHTYIPTCSEVQYPTPRHPLSPSGLSPVSPTASRQERSSGIAFTASKEQIHTVVVVSPSYHVLE